MYNPELYQSNNNKPKRDAQQCLEEHSNKIKWKSSGGSVVDIGCGDGGITKNILKTFIPNNYKTLVGCDISEVMIEYANTNHATDSISFTLLDIESDLPDQFREKYDHAFSFYAMNWIKNQEKAFSNIYDLLEKGGDCLLMILGQLPIYETYRQLARIPRWSHWMKDFARYMSPYHDCQDPEKDIKRMMTTIGFTNVEVELVDKTYSYTEIEAFKNAVMAVNPFKVPLEMENDFWKDYLKVFQDLTFIDHNEDDALNVKIKYTYKTIIVYGKK